MSGLDGFGTSLARGNGATPEVFTVIAGVTNIGAPGLSRETLDVSGHDSPGGYREHLGGLKDGGEISLDVNYKPSAHDLLVADLDDEEARRYKLIYPEGTEWAVDLILTAFEATAPFDDKLTASLTYKVSGKPDITPGS
ncbi:phage tail tube protein [Nocardioides alkalitolerans]|uniref:phage tail tube protein n=1 Tax=Nocardioides alkalitolerans TaxID=281714 RepID=UPI000400ABB7|nr:phage tail tube protein [Nocardioides alkalitolerans]